MGAFSTGNEMELFIRLDVSIRRRFTGPISIQVKSDMIRGNYDVIANETIAVKKV